MAPAEILGCFGRRARHILLRLSADALVLCQFVTGVFSGVHFALLARDSSDIRFRELKMIDILLASLTACSLSASVLSDASAADELMAALKACKADAAAMKSAQAMIKKHGGKPSDDQIDDWVDDQDDKLFDCLDEAAALRLNV